MSLHLDVTDGYQESQRNLSDNVSALFRITLRAFVVVTHTLCVDEIESGLLSILYNQAFPSPTA